MATSKGDAVVVRVCRESGNEFTRRQFRLCSRSGPRAILLRSFFVLRVWMSVSHLSIELLGGVELHGVAPDAAERVLVQPKLVALLAYLALAGATRRYQRR